MSEPSMDPAEGSRPAQTGVWKKICLFVSGLVWAWIVVRAFFKASSAQDGPFVGQTIYLVLMFAGGCLLAVMTYCILMFLKLTLSGAARLLRKEPPLNDAH